MQTQIIKRKRILLIDDEWALRATVKRMLEGRGFHVVDVNNGIQALIMFRQSDFDLVITDFRLPSITGQEVAVTIKAWAPKKPVIMLTGHEKWPSTDNPVDAVILKPFSPADLAQVIDQVLALN